MAVTDLITVISDNLTSKSSVACSILGSPIKKKDAGCRLASDLRSCDIPAWTAIY